MPSKFIILTVNPAGIRNATQHTMQLEKSERLSIVDCLSLVVVLDNSSVEVVSAFNAFLRYGRVSHPLIHEWILNKGFSNTLRGLPHKLVFKISIINNRCILKLYPNQGLSL